LGPRDVETAVVGVAVVDSMLVEFVSVGLTSAEVLEYSVAVVLVALDMVASTW
jgi:hypothetical protein